jgi:glycosyltransferase involved in cell wall biosynthesis
MVVHGPYPQDVRVSREARAAVASGWQVDVVATRQSGEAASETVDGVHVHRLPVEHRRGKGVLAATFEYIGFSILASAKVASLWFRRRYRIIQIHNPPDFLILAALVPKLFRTRVILDIHDFSTFMFQMRFRNKKGARIAAQALYGIERLAVTLADVVVTVHDPYRRELVARGVPNQKICVVMNSVDDALLPVARQGTREGVARIVYHGTVTPRYGLDQLVRAAVMLKRARIDIYGGGDAVPLLAQLAEDLNVADRVTLTGTYLPQREVLQRIRDATVGVICTALPSDEDLGLPTKLFEYVRLRVPVVCADLPVVREHFSGDEVSFFPSGDPEALAAAVQAVIDDPTSAEPRCQAAFRRYEREYAWRVSARRYGALLERLAARRGETPRESLVRDAGSQRPPRAAMADTNMGSTSEDGNAQRRRRCVGSRQTAPSVCVADPAAVKVREGKDDVVLAELDVVDEARRASVDGRGPRPR